MSSSLLREFFTGPYSQMFRSVQYHKKLFPSKFFFNKVFNVCLISQLLIKCAILYAIRIACININVCAHKQKVYFSCKYICVYSTIVFYLFWCDLFWFLTSKLLQNGPGLLKPQSDVNYGN